MTTIAVGDIHGKYQRFTQLLPRLKKYAKGATLVTLGDYVDRGPGSCAVVKLLMSGGLHKYGFAKVVCLKGNHEAMMVDAVLFGRGRQDWLRNGGTETIKSYNGDVDLMTKQAEWMQKLPTSYRDTLRYYVHGGINPDRPLDEQWEEEQLWIRDKFLKDDRKHPLLVVHGHTPVEDVDVRHNRINLDTGAVFDGWLSAAVFNDEQEQPIKIIQV